MRSYTKQSENKLEKVICNQCGRELQVKDGVLQEGVFSASVLWGFFSEKDGEKHTFDLCESCYGKLIKGFQIPVEVEEQTELL